jgi:hypothetical protein
MFEDDVDYTLLVIYMLYSSKQFETPKFDSQLQLQFRATY